MQDEIINKAKDEIIRLTIKLQRQVPFYSYILMHMRCTAFIDNSCPTGCINADGDLFYNPIWFMGLSKDERVFFLLHEAGHMSLLSHTRKGNRDHSVWNIATDLVINDMLIQDGFKPIKDICIANKYGDFVVKDDENKSHKVHVTGRTAEQIYEDLMKILPVIKIALMSDSGGGSDGDMKPTYKGGIDGHMYESSNSEEEADPAAGDKLDDKAKEEINRKWRRIISSADIVSRQAGKMSGFQERFLDKILKPEINWKTVLHRFIQSRIPYDISMRRPGRRSAALGYYTPTIIKENVHIVVAPDVSGSIGEKEYTRFMSEIHAIHNSSNQIHLTVIPWATTVLADDVLDIPIGTRKSLMNYKVSNSGGTRIGSIKDYLKEKSIRPDVCVVFTDGHISDANPEPLQCTTLAVINKGGDTRSLEDYATQITCLDNED